MYSQGLEGLAEVDKLQAAIQCIVKGAFNQVESLKKDLDQKCDENAKLRTENYKLTELLVEYRNRLEICNCLKSTALQKEELRLDSEEICKELKVEAFNEEIEELNSLEFESQFVSDFPVVKVAQKESPKGKEMEELNSLEFESQFVPDVPVVKVAQEESPKAIVWKTPTRPRTTRHILEEIFGPVTQTTAETNIVLAADSPVRVGTSTVTARHYIPETMTQNINETTPRKSDRKAILEPAYGETSPATVNNAVPYASEGSSVSPRIRLTPTGKLMPPKKPRLDIRQLISPSRQSLNDEFGSLTPKKAKASPRKSKSPRAFHSPKRSVPLKKSHRIEAELTHHGVRKLSQAQLNVECFKMAWCPENAEKSLLSQNASHITKQNNPACFGAQGQKEELKQFPRSNTPLHSLENSPDLDETNLSATAITKIAGELVVEKKENGFVTSSYDRIPEKMPSVDENQRAMRRRLPALMCPDCVRWYQDRCENDADLQHAVDNCSRHRTKKVLVPETPEGFWKPAVSPT